MESQIQNPCMYAVWSPGRRVSVESWSVRGYCTGTLPVVGAHASHPDVR